MAAKIKEVMEDFINIYHSEPCIWNVKSVEYSHRPRKEAAYARLQQKLKEIEPCASRDSVLKKINTLRSNFRKELKKVKASKKSGSAAGTTYKPSLWYFDRLSFLKDQCSSPSADNLGSDDQKNREEEVDREEEGMVDIADADGSGTLQDFPATQAHTHKSIVPAPKRLRCSNEEQLLKREVLHHKTQHFNQPKPQEDRFDVFGKYVTVRLGDLPRVQRILAEKLINEILSEAEMNNLNITHRLTSFPHNMLNLIHPPIDHSFSATTISPGIPHSRSLPNNHRPQTSLSTSSDGESVASFSSNCPTNTDHHNIDVQ